MELLWILLSARLKSPRTGSSSADDVLAPDATKWGGFSVLPISRAPLFEIILGEQSTLPNDWEGAESCPWDAPQDTARYLS